MTWKGKDMKSNRFLFQLQVSTHRTKDIGSGLLLTPTTKEDIVNLEAFQKRMEKYPNGTTMPNLATQIHSMMLPTPTLQDYTNSTFPPSQKKRFHLIGYLMKKGILPHSQLNPQFVEEMMGFPKNWTLLPFLNGETNQSKHTETQ